VILTAFNFSGKNTPQFLNPKLNICKIVAGRVVQNLSSKFVVAKEL